MSSFISLYNVLNDMNTTQTNTHNFKGECARIWKGGCIIRAKFLDDIKAAYVKTPELANLLVDPKFASSLNDRQNAWRRIVSLCVARSV